jgi:hypothetical protein
MSVSDWVAGYDLTGTTNIPSFVNYLGGGSADDLHLLSIDTVARDKGLDFSAIFTTDYDGNPRSGTWDIGPFEYQGAPSFRVGTLGVGTLRVGQ